MAENNGKKEILLKDTPMPPLPFAHQIQDGTNEKKNGKAFTDVSKMMETIRDFQDKIRKQLESVYQSTGWTPQYLETFFSNPNNFTSEEWERINKQSEAFMAEDLHKEKKEAKKRPLNPMDFPDESAPKQRRKKNMGARRNWLPMG